MLASTTESDDLKSYDLVWLLHLVGDVHQPLHVVTRVSAAQPEGDQAGHLVSLCRAPCKLDLRAFWNNILGRETTISAAKNLAKSLPAPRAADALVLDEAKWAQESFVLVQTEAYKPPIGAGAGPFAISSAYRASARSVARKQIALAGERLAIVLNAELK